MVSRLKNRSRHARKSHARQANAPTAIAKPSRLRLELLEDRVVLSVETFQSLLNLGLINRPDSGTFIGPILSSGNITQQAVDSSIVVGPHSLPLSHGVPIQLPDGVAGPSNIDWGRIGLGNHPTVNPHSHLPHDAGALPSDARSLPDPGERDAGASTIESRTILWNGETREQAAGQWIVRIDLPAGPGDTMLARAQQLLDHYVQNGAPLPALAHKLQITKFLGGENLFLLHDSIGASYSDVAVALGQLPGLRYISPDFIVHATDTFPNDPLFPNLYGLHNTGQFGGTPGDDIHAPQAWDVTTGSRSIVVGGIDTGIDYDHPDLVNNIWINQAEIPATRLANLTDVDGDGLITFVDLNNPVNQGSFKITDINGDGLIDGSDILAPMQVDGGGNDTGGGGWADGLAEDGDTQHVDDLIGWNFVSNTNNPDDDFGHGTHTAGTIGAVGNNNLGVTGVNWQVQLVALKFLDASGSGTTDGAIMSVNYAVSLHQRGVNIKETSNSWGGGGYDQGLKDAIDASGNEGMLFIAAAGNASNDNDAFPFYPATYDSANIIAVAATDNNDQLAYFSDYGATTVDLGAPGVHVQSTVPSMGQPISDPSGYAYLDGTSMATPHVAGVAALAWSIAPGASYQQIKDAILNGVDADPALGGITVTGGRLNAYNTLQLLGFFVIDTTPSAGQFVSSAPTDFVVQFSNAYEPATVDAGDLTVNGIAADSVDQTDASTLTFHFASSPVTAEGPQSLALADGALARQSDEQPLRGYAATFYYDTLQLAVVSTDPAAGGTIVLPQDLILHFNEAVDPASVNPGNLVLSQGTVTSAAVVSGDPTSVAYHIVGSPTDGSSIDVTLPAGAVLDTDGNPGAGYSASYTADLVTAAYPPLAGKPPAGSLVYDPGVDGTIGAVGDTDSYTIDLDAGQTLSVVATSDPSLQAAITVTAPDGTTIGSATAGAPGGAAFLQTLTVATAGTYTVTIGGANETTGAYHLQLTLNAAVQTEPLTGNNDDTTANAQSLNGAFTDLGHGASRAAVLGKVPGGTSPGDVFTASRGVGIVHLNSAGQVVAQFNLPEFSSGTISDVQLGPDGNLYVAFAYQNNPATGQILKLTTSGDLLATIDLPPDSFGFYYYPFGFDIAPDGTLWIAQANGGNVIHTDAAGNLLASYFTGGTPEDVAVRSDGQVFVADASSGAILQLDPGTGNVFLFNFVFSFPLGLNFTPSGDLWVGDVFNGALRFDSAGNFVQFVSDFDVIDPQVDPAGNLYLTIPAFGNLDKFDPSGNYLQSIGVGGNPIGLTVAGVDGTSQLPPVDTSDYYSFTLSKNQTATIALTKLSGSSAHIDLENASGTVLATGNSANMISDFVATATGTYYLHVTGNGVGYSLLVTRNADFDTESNNGVASAQSLFANSTGARVALGDIAHGAGDLFGVDWQQASQQLFHAIDPATGAFTTTFNGPTTPLTNPFGFNLAFDGSSLYFNDGAFFGSNTIYKLDPGSGAVVDSFPAPVPFTLLDIAWLGGSLYATDSFNIYQIDPASHSLVRTLNTTLDGATTGLAGDPSRGVLWAVSQFGTIFEIDPVADQLIKTGPDASNGLYEQDMAFQNNELYVSDTNGPGANEIVVYDPDTLAVKRRMPADVPIFISGLGGDGILGDPTDWYRFPARAGDRVSITTQTPYGDPQFPLQPHNGLDPAIELYDSSGNLIASDDNSGTDGKNAALTFTVPANGTYVVRVLGANSTTGEYTLAVTGAQGSKPAFKVSGTNPPALAKVASLPTLTVNFNQDLLLPTLDASDLTANGLAATAVQVVNGRQVIFTLPDLGGGQDVPIHFHIADGAIRSVSNTPITGFSETIYLDTVAPIIIGTSFEEGKVLNSGSVTYTVTFSEPMNTSSAAFDLLGNFRGTYYFPDSASYNANGTKLTLHFSNLPDDQYTLTLYAFGFFDRVNHPLDGEPHTPRPPSVPTGDGVPGGNFFIDFVVDLPNIVAFPTPLGPVAPNGSQIYDPSATGVIAPAGDPDRFSISIDPGQTITLDVVPDHHLQPTVSLYDPHGHLLGSAAASAAGSEALLNAIPTVDHLGTGTYTIEVSSAGGTIGLYHLHVILNAALETESHGGGDSNNTIDTAQPLDNSFIDEGAGASRGAVLGQVDGGNFAGPDAYGYEGIGVPFSFTDISGTGTGVLQGTDDSVFQLLPSDLGTFHFNFYGTDYNSLFFSTNGLITFGSPWFEFFNQDLSAFPPQASIAPLWDDLEAFGSPGVVYWEVLGSGDNQQLVIQWNQMQFFASGGTITFQAILNEADGTIQFNYLDLDAGRADHDGGASATVGIKDAGTQGGNRLLMSYNSGPNGLVGTGQSTLIGFNLFTITPDYYSFHLDAGQVATVTLNNLGKTQADMALVDDLGNVLALPTTGATNVDEVINNYVAPSSGTYYLMIEGTHGSNYSLVVNRGNTFDQEGNNDQAHAQPIIPSADRLGLPGGGAGDGGALGAIVNPGNVAVGSNFEGLHFTDTFCGCLPPDNGFAVGDGYVMEAVNTAIRISDMAGNNLLTEELSSFFNLGLSSGGDPYIVFDDIAQRWYVSSFTGDFQGLEIAVSNDANPLDGFDLQTAFTYSGQEPDFNKIGFNADEIVITSDLFGSNVVHLIAIDKSALINTGTFVTYEYDYRNFNTDFDLEPAKMHGSQPGDPMYLVEEAGFGSGQAIRVVRLDNGLSDSPQFTATDLQVNPYSEPALANQPGGFPIATNSSFIVSVDWRNGVLAAAHNVSVADDGFTTARARWYEIDTTGATPTLIQQGTVDRGDGVSTYMPSVALNASGDLGITWIESSSEEFMSMYVAVHEHTGAPGSLTAPADVRPGDETLQVSFRSGDYSNVVVDPDNPDVFWASNEYAPANGFEDF